MAFEFEVDRSSVVVLYKGGRLPSWGQLTTAEQDAASQEHVDLMLEIGHEHGLKRLEGFKLVGPHKDWERFWLIEFPTMAGAEAWIEAEMAPPTIPLAADPRHIAELWTDRSSAVLLLFGALASGRRGAGPDRARRRGA